MTSKRTVLGNWKMNTSRDDAVTLAHHLVAAELPESVTVGIAPPFLWLEPVKEALNSSPILLGAQTSAATTDGAYTGEVSVAMIAELCDFVLIGHSERRTMFGETDEIVRQKLMRTAEIGLVPVLCVGETIAQRLAGDAERVVIDQVSVALGEIPNDQLTQLIVAYEPVWAIGSGQTASPQDAAAMCGVIGVALAGRKLTGIPILYGGSVTAENAASLIAAENVSGFLVGGASLKQDDFVEIVRAAGV